jgi:predicted nucleotidyltransferase
MLKYKIDTSSKKELAAIHMVDEGLENRIKKAIDKSTTLEAFILEIKTKRYTYSRINRMLTHILVNYTKDDRTKVDDIEYSRILGINQKGRNYIKSIRDNAVYPIITKQSELDSFQLDLEHKVSKVYNHTTKEGLDQLEYQNFALFIK